MKMQYHDIPRNGQSIKPSMPVKRDEVWGLPPVRRANFFFFWDITHHTIIYSGTRTPRSPLYMFTRLETSCHRSLQTTLTIWTHSCPSFTDRRLSRLLQISFTSPIINLVLHYCLCVRMERSILTIQECWCLVTRIRQGLRDGDGMNRLTSFERRCSIRRHFTSFRCMRYVKLFKCIAPPFFTYSPMSILSASRPFRPGKRDATGSLGTYRRGG